MRIVNNLDADALVRYGRRLPVPFALSVISSDGRILDVTVFRVLRLLPSKRIVAVAEVEGENFLVKIFIGAHSRRYFQRELSGAKKISAAGVLTAALQWRGELKSASAHVLGFEFLEGAKDLLQTLRDSENNKVELLLVSKLVPVIATLHEKGVLQNDIHPGNFLFLSESVYTIDGGDVTRRNMRPLSTRKSLDNLALFLAQFQSLEENILSACLDKYCQIRGWPLDSNRFEHLTNLIQVKSDQRKRDYVRKSFRECSQFASEHTIKRFSVCQRVHDTPAMRNLLNRLDERIASGELLKDGKSATVALVNGPSGKLVIKRYNIKSLSHGFARAFQNTRGWVSWANANRLKFLGIRAVAPVALVEERIGPIRRRAYFITEYIEGADLMTLAENDDPSEEIEAIVKIIKDMFAAGISHGDLKASNFILASDGPVIIDLDSMKEHRSQFAKHRAEKRDIARFMKNWSAESRVWNRFADLLF